MNKLNLSKTLQFLDKHHVRVEVIAITDNAIYVKNPFNEHMAIKFDHYGKTAYSSAFELINTPSKRTGYTLLRYCKDIDRYYTICASLLYHSRREALEAKNDIYGDNNEIIVGEVTYYV